MKRIYTRHPWQSNAGCEQPCRMICYDTESIQTPNPQRPGRTNHTLRLGVASYWRRYGDEWRRINDWVFRDCEAFWRGVYSRLHDREPLWIFSHNQSFDFTLTRGWDELQNNRLKMGVAGQDYIDRGTGCVRRSRDRKGILAVDGTPFLIVCWHDRSCLKIVDTLNYLPVSLAKIARWVGLRKGILPGENDSDDNWLTYCRNDVMILEACVQKLFALWRGRKLGNWQPTISSLAYSSFRHLSPKSGIVAHGDAPQWPIGAAPTDSYGTGTRLDCDEVAAVERRAYFGGQVLVNYIGEIRSPESLYDGVQDKFSDDPSGGLCGPITVLDVNGLYASVMSSEEYPIEIMETVRNPTLKIAAELCRHFPCIADVEIETLTETYPCRTGRRVLYPLGRYTTALCGRELMRAITEGHAIQVSNLCAYYKGRPFKEFVNYWWRYKEECVGYGDECGARLAKLVINGLFGKLGQRQPLWETVHDIPPLVPWGGFVYDTGDGRGVRRYRSVGATTQAITDRRDCRHTFTAAASFVTQYGRERMRANRRVAGDHTVLYQDTDSLFCVGQGYARLEAEGLIHATEMGKLKVQGIYEHTTIIAPKVYLLGTRLVAAGLPANAVSIGNGSWKATQFQRGGDIITGNPQGIVQSWNQLCHFPQSVYAVKVNDNGWTEPHVIRGNNAE